MKGRFTHEGKIITRDIINNIKSYITEHSLQTLTITMSSASCRKLESRSEKLTIFPDRQSSD